MPIKPLHKLIALLVLAFLVWHFVAGLSLQLPKESLPGGLRNMTWHYARPAFNQNWKLFAPEPPRHNKRLFLRYRYTDGTYSEVLDPAKEWRQNASRNPLSPEGKLYQLCQNIAHYMFQDYQMSVSTGRIGDSSSMEFLTQGLGYTCGVHFAQHLAKSYSQKQVGGLQLMLWSKAVGLDAGEDDYLIYPEIAIH